MYSFNINMVNLIKTLSMAVDLAVNGVNKHHWRTAFICRCLADELRLSQDEQQQLLYVALLHDIGAAPNLREHLRLLDPDQESVLGDGIYYHAESGYELLSGSFCFSGLAASVRYHHDSWCGGNPSGLSGQAIPLPSRIVHLADRVEVMLDPATPILSQRRAIVARISERSGKGLDPGLVDAFRRCAERETFWLDMSLPDPCIELFDELNQFKSVRLSGKDILSVAELYATIIDRMSAFTATHSRSVAGVAVMLAEQLGFCADELAMMQVAGLLHDIGKLSVSNHILEKPGKLDDDEHTIMRQHTYYTYHILRQLNDFEQIARWAAFHHETLDGQGYPFRVGAAGLPLGSRVMVVADIFVALREDRPYRGRMERPQIEQIMRELVTTHKIDARIVDVLFDCYPQADGIVHGPYTSAVA